MSQFRSCNHVAALLRRGPQSTRAGLQLRVNGELESGFVFQTAHPNRPIRLAVGRPGMRSSVWRIWANQGTSDIYIASRHTAGHHKISLHQSGDYRYQTIGFKKPYQHLSNFAIAGQLPEGRLVGSWSRPEPQLHGWTDAMRIVIPTSELFDSIVPVDTSSDVKQTQWIEPAPRSQAVEIRIFVVRPNLGPFDLSEVAYQPGGVAIWGGMTLTSGEVVVVMSAHIAVGSNQEKEITRLKHIGKSSRHFDSDLRNAPRILAPDFETDYATFWDLGWE